MQVGGVQVVVYFGCASRRKVVEVREVAMGLVIGHLLRAVTPLATLAAGACISV